MNERETMIASASFAAGWDAALDAAREALVIAERRLHFDGEDNRWIVEIDALAAIDALREKP